MEKNLGDIRKLLKYEFELDHNTKEAVTNINRAKRAGTVAYSTAKRWFSKFRSGNLKTDDKKRSGRPREVDRDTVVNTVEDHPSITTRMLADEFNCNHTEIEKILKEAVEEMRESLTEFFTSKDRDWYRSGIHQLEEQLQKVIESDGEYF
uniref:Mos1 transposase HTH domain-containing protein n=1 Tax=Acrobeloides nanus TaxID=290746 RepID=A0A914CX78_9BILA